MILPDPSLESLLDQMTPRDRHAYLTGCDTKRRFVTRNEAAHCASEHRRQGRKGFRPYHCTFGDHWHIGHNTAAAATGRRRQDNRP